MNNNDIFKKLRVALQLRDDQIEEILMLVDFRISKGEIGNFFRTTDHPKYVECGDQVLRNFLNGLVIHLRGTKDDPKDPREVLAQNRPVKAAPFVQKKPAEKKPVEKKTASRPKSYPVKKSPVENVRFKNGKPKS